MAFTAGALADGQLSTTKTAIYTVPTSTVGYVKVVNFFNTNAAAQTIIVYINSSGTSRKFRRFVLEQNESAALLDEGETIMLSAGDTIEAETTTASAVDYFVSGVEEA